MFGVKPRF